MVEKKDVQKTKKESKKPEPKVEEKPTVETKAVGRKPLEKQDEKKPKKDELRAENIIRLAETNLDATKPVRRAIRRISGVGFMFSDAVANVCGFGDKKLGDLTEEERQKLENILMHPEKYDIPSWLYNRRRDPVTGEDKHLTVSQLELTKKMDIGQMKKLKTYRGVRHSLGLPVRGQRTRSSFRHGRSVGVIKKKAQQSSGKKQA